MNNTVCSAEKLRKHILTFLLQLCGSCRSRYHLFPRCNYRRYNLLCHNFFFRQLGEFVMPNYTHFNVYNCRCSSAAQNCKRGSISQWSLALQIISSSDNSLTRQKLKKLSGRVCLTQEELPVIIQLTLKYCSHIFIFCRYSLALTK